LPISHPREHLLSTAVLNSVQITRFLNSQVSDPNDAQDLMQELYIRILKIQSPNAIQCPRAYLYKIAANLAFEHRRRRDTRPKHVALNEVPLELLVYAGQVTDRASWLPRSRRSFSGITMTAIRVLKSPCGSRWCSTA
jgi:DNA-directed RNA polymerase specialized sigma24 family protein